MLWQRDAGKPGFVMAADNLIKRTINLARLLSLPPWEEYKQAERWLKEARVVCGQCTSFTTHNAQSTYCTLVCPNHACMHHAGIDKQQASLLLSLPNAAKSHRAV